jgi:GH15 family glucan-1,4-alpha-glucosidase
MVRVDSYAAIEEYAAIGDGRTVALVARDGSIDWLPVPHLDDPPVFAAILDAAKGGRFALAPVEPFETGRSYVDQTNVLETRFRTDSGEVRVTDALTTQDGGLLPWVELARRIEGVKGEVELAWLVEPRFDYGLASTVVESHGDGFVASNGHRYLLIRSWDAGQPEQSADSVTGRFRIRKGECALLVVAMVEKEPIPFPQRHEVERRIDGSVEAWRRWVDDCYEGPWRDAVIRSALTLKLLIQAPTGAIAAAATSSLPERIGGDRNYDYRYSWIRDSAFALEALAGLGFREQVHGSLSWLLKATWPTHPRMHPFYSVDGGVPRDYERLDLHGYRGSKPVVKGNSAEGQSQLADYGDLLETIHLYVQNGNALDRETGIRLAEVADFVCRVWENTDSGIWELQNEQHYTVSKIGCWLALDRAQRLAAAGEIPRENVATWETTADLVREFVEEQCWSVKKQAYTFFAGTDDLDAAVLLGGHQGFFAQQLDRLHTTADAIMRELSAGPLLYRYTGQDQVEGAFLPCSFWLANALHRCGRAEEASRLMDQLVALANDVGLYAEEIDPATGHMLGNFPQALTHLALINAATVIAGQHEGDE